LLFWVLIFIFLLNSFDLLSILLYSEITWVILYCYTIIVGVSNDELITTTTSILLLALAGLEFCIGFIITIFFRNFKKIFNIDGDLIKNLKVS